MFKTGFKTSCFCKNSDLVFNATLVISKVISTIVEAKMQTDSFSRQERYLIFHYSVYKFYYLNRFNSCQAPDYDNNV